MHGTSVADRWADLNAGRCVVAIAPRQRGRRVVSRSGRHRVGRTCLKVALANADGGVQADSTQRKDPRVSSPGSGSSAHISSYGDVRSGHGGRRLRCVFADRLQLLAIAHPRQIEVFPNEGMTEPPKAFRLHAVTDQRAPIRATDDHGHDVSDRIARVDRRYPDDFPL